MSVITNNWFLNIVIIRAIYITLFVGRFMPKKLAIIFFPTFHTKYHAEIGIFSQVLRSAYYAMK